MKFIHLQSKRALMLATYALLIVQSVFIFFGALVFGLAFSGIFGFSIFPLPPFVVTPLFVIKMRKYKAKTTGTREPALASIRDGGVQVTRRSGTSTVPAELIRRLVIGNTYDQNRVPGTSKYVTSAAQAHGIAVRERVDAILTRVSFTLELQHDNDRTLIVDGLDKLTADNLLGDMSKNLQMA